MILLSRFILNILTMLFQIRIVTKPSDIESEGSSESKKKKKPHRGYAFIVYEREKDMKGIPPSPPIIH